MPAPSFCAHTPLSGMLCKMRCIAWRRYDKKSGGRSARAVELTQHALVPSRAKELGDRRAAVGGKSAGRRRQVSIADERRDLEVALTRLGSCNKWLFGPRGTLVGPRG